MATLVVAFGGPRCALALDGCFVFVNDKAAVGVEATGSEKAAVGAEATGTEKAAVGADTTGPNKAAAGSIGSAGIASATTLAEAASPVADAEKFLRNEVIGFCAANGWLLLALALPFGNFVNRLVVSSTLAVLIRLAKALAEPLIRANGSELRVEQGSGDLALAFLPLTLQFNQFPLVLFQQVLQNLFVVFLPKDSESVFGHGDPGQLAHVREYVDQAPLPNQEGAMAFGSCSSMSYL